jgi:hypothetical protein
MSRNHDHEARWLRAIADHPDTTEADYAMAQDILGDEQLTFDQRNRPELKHLEDLQFLYVNPGGTWGAWSAGQGEWRPGS